MSYDKPYWIGEDNFTYIPYLFRGTEVMNGLEKGILSMSKNMIDREDYFGIHVNFGVTKALVMAHLFPNLTSRESIGCALKYIDTLVNQSSDSFAVPIKLNTIDIEVSFLVADLLFKGVRLGGKGRKDYAVLMGVGPYEDGNAIGYGAVCGISDKVGQKPKVKLEMRMKQLGMEMPELIYDALMGLVPEEPDEEHWVRSSK